MRDLMIISRSRVEMSTLIDQFPDLTTRYEVRMERRWHERRSAGRAHGEDRRQKDRRQLDVTPKLLRDGWVVVSATQRQA